MYLNLETLARDIRRFASNAHMATCVGNPAKVTEDFRLAMASLSPGDLVAEITCAGREGPHLNAVGYLKRIAEEPVEYDEGDVWDEEYEGRPHPTERIYYIRTLDDREMRWKNARFVSLPNGPHQFNQIR